MRIIILLFHLTFLITPAFAELPTRTTTSVSQAVLKEMKRQDAVGVAIGIIQDGRVVYTKGYGYADREKKIPMSTNTMLRWASVSKTLTAVRAAQLWQSGKLSLDKDVRSYVPEFPDKGVKITSRQLLSHKSGIVHYRNGQVIRTKRKYSNKHPFKSVILALDTFKESPLISRPGLSENYTTHGYILLSAVLERAGNMQFAKQINNNISSPLQLTSLQPDYQWIDIPKRATGYKLKNGKVVTDVDEDVSWKLGGGGFISNIDDAASFAASLLGNKLISPTTKKTFWKTNASTLGKDKYGLGFRVSGTGKKLKVWHTGSQAKARTRLVLYPNQNHGMVVFSNSRHSDPAKISTAIYKALKSSAKK